MSEQQVHITINLDGLRAQLARSLQKTILLVAAGLQNIDSLNAEFLELPTPFKIALDPELRWSKEVAHENYSEWVLSNGFRDAIEQVSMFLEEAHRVLAIWELVDQDGELKLTGSEWNELIIDGDSKFHRLGLPHKLDHLRHNHKLPLDESLVSHLSSINTARNCLVHRRGIVSKRDLNTTAQMEVTWRRMYFFLQEEGGEKPLHIGEPLEQDSMLCMRFQDISRSFYLGHPVRFSVQEFLDACWTLFLFGDDLVQKMSVFGLQHGFLKANVGTGTKLAET